MGLRGVVGVCGGYGAAGLPVGGCVLVCGGRPAARGRDLARRAGWRGGETDKYFAAFRGEIEMILFRFFFYRCMNESPHFPQFPGRMAGARGRPSEAP